MKTNHDRIKNEECRRQSSRHARFWRQVRLCFCLLPSAFCLPAWGQGTAFTYQGRLNDGAGPANGIYDLRFTIYDLAANGTLIGGPLTNSATGVSNGLFAVTLDFGATPFTGADRWLEMAVRTNAGGAFTTLNSRQKLTPSPYAIFANTASNVSGTIPNGALPPSPIFSGTVTANAFSGNGANLTALDADNITSGTLADTRLSANVALLNASETFTGNLTINDPATLSFGLGNGRQMLNLWGTQYGMGVQSYTLYFRTDDSFPGASFAWYQGGVHNNGNLNPGGGKTLMVLDKNGSLRVTNTVVASGLTVNGTAAVNALTVSGPATITGDLNLSATSPTIFSGTSLLLHADTNANLFVGGNAGNLTLSGDQNTGTGSGALKLNTTGSFNTASGYQALNSNGSGNWNTAIGNQALFSNTSGEDNTADGYQAMYLNHSGSDNTAEGFQALYFNTNGQNNIAIGEQALFSNTSGGNNIALGQFAGGDNTTGSGNIDIDNPGNSSDNYIIRIGLQGIQNNAFIAGIYNTPLSIGAGVYVNSDGKLGIAASSARFKQNIQGMGDVSDVLLALRPVTFQYKPEIDPQGIPQFGLVAEEVAEVDPDLVLRDGHGKPYTVRYEAVNAMLLNEFLKQHRTVQAQNSEIQDLKQQNEALKNRLDNLEQMVKSLVAKD